MQKQPNLGKIWKIDFEAEKFGEKLHFSMFKDVIRKIIGIEIEQNFFEKLCQTNVMDFQTFSRIFECEKSEEKGSVYKNSDLKDFLRAFLDLNSQHLILIKNIHTDFENFQEVFLELSKNKGFIDE